jgi:hypothetical protein
MLLPLAALTSALAIRRGARVLVTWLPVLALSSLVTLSGWAAVQTGEREEEAVEEAVAESTIHEHEERAELFMLSSLLALGMVVTGLATGPRGNLLRGAATVATFALWVPAYRVGHSGGELVYTHGAATVYVSSAASATGSSGEDEGESATRSEKARAH